MFVVKVLLQSLQLLRCTLKSVSHLRLRLFPLPAKIQLTLIDTQSLRGYSLHIITYCLQRYNLQIVACRIQITTYCLQRYSSQNCHTLSAMVVYKLLQTACEDIVYNLLHTACKGTVYKLLHCKQVQAAQVSCCLYSPLWLCLLADSEKKDPGL